MSVGSIDIDAQCGCKCRCIGLGASASVVTVARARAREDGGEEGHGLDRVGSMAEGDLCSV